MIHASQRANLLGALASAIRDESEQSGLLFEQAFSRIAAEWLGYALEEQAFIDTAGDRGIDFWFQSDAGFDIFQVKSHDPNDDGSLNTSAFDNEGVKDLNRASTLLLSGIGEVRNSGLKNFKHHWEHAISSRRAAKEPPPIVINFGLVILGDSLTEGAKAEFDALAQAFATAKQISGVPLQFSAALYTVDDLLDRRWRLDNRSWKDITGSKKDYIDLSPDNLQQMLSTSDSAVFYCRAYDLVRAYREFGYQLFEPNVRCNITVSKVNAAIRETLKTKPGREEFRVLNNGITLICKGFAKPSGNRPHFRVTQPGVVNGLQTVFALSEAYSNLTESDKEHFENHCYVLVRLLQEHCVKDVYRLVRATNTQNPMQARNLVSNNPEQILFERIFADQLGWFYERKQGAWEAFAADPRRWRSLPNKSRDVFQFGTGGRPRVRRADNELLGQAWLSFIGFSEEAVHRKRDIFENDKFYDFIFLHTPTKHGGEYHYSLEEAREHALNQAPSPHLMLIALLIREFARRVAPTAKENTESACARLGIDPAKLTREKLQVRLSDDPEYNLGQITNGMSFVFTEFAGYVLFRAFGGSLISAAPRILQNGSLGALTSQLNWDEVRQKVTSIAFEGTDILPVIWWAFSHVLDELIHSPWLESYRQARNRTRFNHASETRERLTQGSTAT